MRMGNDEYGINCLCPPEVLHQFLLGLLKLILDTLISRSTIHSFRFLDKVAIYIANNWHRQSSRNYPDISIFRNGITEDKLTGKEVLSQCFIIYLCLLQKNVRNKFVRLEISSDARYSIQNEVIVDQQNDTTNTRKTKIFLPKVGSTHSSIKKWLKVFEYSLYFYAWLNLEEIPFSDCNPYNTNTKSSSQISTEIYLQLVKDVVFKNKSMAIMKIHQTKHYDFYIKRLGSASNFDGSIGERHQKFIAKNPGRRTQRRAISIENQSSFRYFENILIDIVFNILYQKGTRLVGNRLPRPSCRGRAHSCALQEGGHEKKNS